MSVAEPAEGWERIHLRAMADLLLVFEPESLRIVEISERSCEKLGRSRAEIIGTTVSNWLHPDDLGSLPAIVKRVTQAGSMRYRQRWATASGDWLLYDMGTSVGDEPHMVSAGTDISMLAASDKQIESFLRLVDIMDDAMLVTDGAGRITYVNDGALRMWGSPDWEPVGQPLMSFIDPEHLDAFFKLISDAVEGDNRSRNRLTVIRADRTRLTVDARTAWDPESGSWYTIARDITAIVEQEQELRELNEKLDKLATTDHLTGLPNRSVLAKELDKALDADEPFALIVIDVNDFKSVNDDYGHHAGDLLLKELARRMRSVTRRTDLASRYGGDEFVVLCPDVSTEEVALDRANTIHHELSGSFSTAEEQVAFSCSVGVALARPGRDTAVDLFRRADAAAYEAKAERATMAIFRAT